MADPFSTVQTELPRDRWGRPLITPPEGGDPVAYMRCTTFVGCLEDTYNLQRWGERMTALGMARRRDLTLAASAITDPTDRFQKRTLNDIAKQAKDAAGAGAAAITGTALHTMSEKIDRGEPTDGIPEEFLSDLEAYRRVTKGLETVAIEGFCVRDDLQVGGSYDRIIRFTDEFLDAYEREHGGPLYYPKTEGSPLHHPVQPGDAVIGDLKTGNVDFGMGKIAMQLGVYANSVDYDHGIGTRSPLAGNPSKDWGVVIHLPAGSGNARLLWVDVRSGWETARDVATKVHAWRKRNNELSTQFASTAVTPRQAPTLVELIQSAASYDELTSLYAMNSAKWTPGLTDLAKARRAELEAAK
jgi:hypothetical protein